MNSVSFVQVQQADSPTLAVNTSKAMTIDEEGGLEPMEKKALMQDFVSKASLKPPSQRNFGIRTEDAPSTESMADATMS